MGIALNGSDGGSDVERWSKLKSQNIGKEIWRWPAVGYPVSPQPPTAISFTDLVTLESVARFSIHMSYLTGIELG